MPVDGISPPEPFLRSCTHPLQVFRQPVLLSVAVFTASSGKVMDTRSIMLSQVVA